MACFRHVTLCKAGSLLLLIAVGVSLGLSLFLLESNRAKVTHYAEAKGRNSYFSCAQHCPACTNYTIALYHVAAERHHDIRSPLDFIRLHCQFDNVDLTYYRATLGCIIGFSGQWQGSYDTFSNSGYHKISRACGRAATAQYRLRTPRWW